MTEAIFPIVGAVLVLLFVMPVSAMLARVVLVAADRFMPPSWFYIQQELRYFSVVMASAAPLLWFASAGLHQAESGVGSKVCALEHAATESLCPEPWFFALALVLYAMGFALTRSSSYRTRLVPRSARRNARLEARVDALVSACPELRRLEGYCEVIDDLTIPIAAVGIAQPRIVLSAEFVQQLDDDALVGALHHELEHVRGHDPLRFLIAAWALRVNPWGRIFLHGELSRWRFERELQCDKEAVANGADAAAIAHAIVTAARRSERSVAALGDTDGRALKLRVELLLAYQERPPARSSRHSAFGATVAAAVVWALLPHGGRTWALDAVHVVAETTVLAITS
ncbi:MAG TPA: M56 family metallopeptidase [Polyangiales bacterium]|nr:M56 family metallopeptidase [Polyangiales bacterium]